MAVGSLAVAPAPGPGRAVAVPLIVTAVFWFDALVVVIDRVRSRQESSNNSTV